MFPPDETVTSLPIGSLIFGTRFLITLLHLLLLPALNVNSVSFTLMNSHCFYICFNFLVFRALVSVAICCLCVLLTHCFFTLLSFIGIRMFVSQNKFDLIWAVQQIALEKHAAGERPAFSSQPAATRPSLLRLAFSALPLTATSLPDTTIDVITGRWDVTSVRWYTRNELEPNWHVLSSALWHANHLRMAHSVVIVTACNWRAYDEDILSIRTVVFFVLHRIN